jgi:hypothetical protein
VVNKKQTFSHENHGRRRGGKSQERILSVKEEKKRAKGLEIKYVKSLANMN